MSVAEAWFHFDLVLGLTAELLPVPQPGVPASPRSSIREPGKVPGVINGAEQFTGFPRWTSYVSTGRDIERWSSDARLGICLQTRRVRAIDIDVADPTAADEIEDFVTAELGMVLPCRTRSNSGKRLLIVIVPGEIGKRVIPVAGGMVELLGNGQQCVVAGLHPSGVPYAWRGGLPAEVPEISLERYEALIAALQREFGTSKLSATHGQLRKRECHLPIDDPFADWLEAKGLVLGNRPDGGLNVVCPWEHEHTTPTGDDAAAYFPAGTNGHEHGGWKCLHGHCAGRSLAHYEQAVGYVAEDFEELGEDELTAPIERATISATPYMPRDPASIPPRPWVYGRQLLRGSLSLLIAPGASGKTSLLAATALALATGCPLLGYPVHGGPKRVWLWNLEDSTDELSRLIEAARSHYMIEAEEIAGRLYVDSGIDGAALCLASQRPGKPVELAEAIFIAIEREIAARQIDVLILDPFVSTHRAAENDNSAIDAIAKRLARIAVDANCSVLVSHHTAKLGGGEVSAEKARGASALVNAARSAVAINRLTAMDAPKIGFDPLNGMERCAFERFLELRGNWISASAQHGARDRGDRRQTGVVDRGDKLGRKVGLELVNHCSSSCCWRTGGAPSFAIAEIISPASPAHLSHHFGPNGRSASRSWQRLCRKVGRRSGSASHRAQDR